VSDSYVIIFIFIFMKTRENLGELLPELVQLLLQGRALLLCGRHLVADLADLRVDARRHDNADRLAGGDVGALGVRRRGGAAHHGSDDR